MISTDWQTDREKNQVMPHLLDVLFCEPGLQAILLHRVAHRLYTIGISIIPRIISHFNRFLTGIEIHPGAKIGKGVLISHGMGVVIGQTACIGDYAVIREGVTLGGTGKSKGKRHPTLGHHVIVEAGAKILGNIQIGDNVCIAAGAVVLQDVPSHSLVMGIPGRIINGNCSSSEALSSDYHRDMQAEVIRSLFERVKALEQQVEQLQVEGNLSISQNGFQLTRRELVPDPNPSKAQNNRVIEEFLNGTGI